MSAEQEVSRVTKMIKKHPLGCVMLALNVGIGLGLLAALFI